MTGLIPNELHGGAEEERTKAARSQAQWILDNGGTSTTSVFGLKTTIAFK